MKLLFMYDGGFLYCSKMFTQVCSICIVKKTKTIKLCHRKNSQNRKNVFICKGLHWFEHWLAVMKLISIICTCKQLILIQQYLTIKQKNNVFPCVTLCLWFANDPPKAIAFTHLSFNAYNDSSGSCNGGSSSVSSSGLFPARHRTDTADRVLVARVKSLQFRGLNILPSILEKKPKTLCEKH